MKFVAQRLTIGRELRKVHLFQQHSKNAIHRGIIRHLDRLAFAACGIPDFDGNHSHSPKSTSPGESRQIIQTAGTLTNLFDGKH